MSNVSEGLGGWPKTLMRLVADAVRAGVLKRPASRLVAFGRVGGLSASDDADATGPMSGRPPNADDRPNPIARAVA